MNSDNTGEDDAQREFKATLRYDDTTIASALAMRKDALKAPQIELMKEKNWLIIDATSPLCEYNSANE